MHYQQSRTCSSATSTWQAYSCVNVPVCSVAQFTTDDIGLIWLTSSNQTTAALTYLRTLASNTSYGILGESSTLHHHTHSGCCLVSVLNLVSSTPWIHDTAGEQLVSDVACASAMADFGSASAAWAMQPVCKHCLGRLYACIA